MGTNENGQKEIVEKAAKILSGAKTVYLATNGSHGHPNLRAMAPAMVDGIESVWFMTFAGSSKVKEILRDNHAVLYAWSSRSGTECRLWGTVDVLDDAASKKKVWSEEFREHFPDGPSSENMRVLRFNVSNGTYVNKKMEAYNFEN